MNGSKRRQRDAAGTNLSGFSVIMPEFYSALAGISYHSLVCFSKRNLLFLRTGNKQ